jgi:sugar phosphate isomerase/epimerase
MRPRLAICHRPADDLELMLRTALECGADAGVEVTLDPEDGTHLGGIAATIRRAGLSARYHYPLCGHQLASADPGEAARAEAEMSRALQSVADAGGTHFTVHAALHIGSRQTGEFARTAEHLSRIAEVGRRLGVRVCVENLRWGDTSDPAVFLDLVESTGAGATVDVGHASSSDASAHGIGADRFVALLAPHIETAHVYEREDHAGHHAPEKLNGMQRALDALCETTCDWWTVELHDPGETAATCRLLRNFLDSRYGVREAGPATMARGA